LLARLLVRRRNREFILGDLDELFARRVVDIGATRATMLYLRDVMLSAAGGLGSGGDAAPLALASLRSSGGRGRWVAPKDFQLALRGLLHRPTFALTTMGILALGIGPAAAVFDMADQLLLGPLPGVPNTSSAAYLVFGTPGRHEGLTLLDFDELRRSTTLVNGMASFGSMTAIVTPDHGRPIQVSATSIYGDYFEILGTTATEGRLLDAEETGLDSNPFVAVISETLRNQAFGAEEAIGRTITMNGRPVEVVGVVASSFKGAVRGASTEAWLPFSSLVPLVGFTEERLRGRESATHRDIVVGLREGIAPEPIEDQVGRVFAGIAAASPDIASSLPEAGPTIYPGLHMSPGVRESTQRTLGMMAWAAALILAISCANVANLLLFRNLTRRGALATLRALGASSGQLARQQLAESLLLGALGAVAGIGVAWLISLPFRGQSLARMPAFEGLRLDSSTLLFVAVAALATTALFGAAPAALAGRFDLGDALRASRARDTGRMGLLRTALCVGQISLTLALLVGGLLMVRTIANLRAVETGLDIDGVAWTYITDLTNSAPTAADHLRKREVLAALTAIPDVEAAALDMYGPHGSQFMDLVRAQGSPDPEPGTDVPTAAFQVTPGWFELFRMTPISGRTFTGEDWKYPPGDGVVLTASLARRLFGRTDVAGSRVIVGRRNATERIVLGVVGDYRSMTSPTEITDAFFVPYGAIPFALQFSVMTRVREGDVATLARVREVLESFYPSLPVSEPYWLSERVEFLRVTERLLGYLLGILSAFGVIMSAVGLYGVIYFIVSSRKRELGIRRALGADGVRIVRLVGRSAAIIVVSGALLGALVAYPVSRLLQTELFGVGSLDPASYAGAFALVLVAAVAAIVSPARAALRVDPVTVLKEE
jgi:predicted permease